jgi:hypothetical protein
MSDSLCKSIGISETLYTLYPTTFSFSESVQDKTVDDDVVAVAVKAVGALRTSCYSYSVVASDKSSSFQLL